MVYCSWKIITFKVIIKKSFCKHYFKLILNIDILKMQGKIDHKNRRIDLFKLSFDIVTAGRMPAKRLNLLYKLNLL